MKPFKKSQIAKTTTCRKEYKIVTNPDMRDPYWDECYNYYKLNEWKKKQQKTLVDVSS